MDRNRIIATALNAPSDAIRRTLASEIRAATSGLHLAEVQNIYRTLYRFAAKGNCTFQPIPDFNADYLLSVDRERLQAGPQVAWWEIEWKETRLELVVVQILDGFQRAGFSILMSEKSSVTGDFLIALSKFASEVEGAVLVFQDGCWSYDEDLYADIQSYTMDNLVLPDGMAAQIQSDVQNWMDSRELYEQHGIPWKRGMILVGPPGNGKTHMIKALVNHFDLNALYVRGFSSEYGTDSQNISKVFERARDCAPAMLILEDLDSLVDSENRSHFLNELDGFARNTGILAVASANDPAKLDPALVNRPSRFDRRYAFDLPEASERARYLITFTQSLDPCLQLKAEDAASIGAAADGFSYAYLKELVLSSMMAWISNGQLHSFPSEMASQVVQLAQQMELDPEPTPARSADGPDAVRKKQMAAYRRMSKM